MLRVLPEGIMVLVIVWEGAETWFRADLNQVGDQFCDVETETTWALNWTIDAWS